MANKKTTQKSNPSGYDRWDTFTGSVRVTSKNTPSQQRAIDEINAQQKNKKKK